MTQSLCIYLTNLYYSSVGYYFLVFPMWHTKLIESDQLSFCIHTVGPISSTFFAHCRPPQRHLCIDTLGYAAENTKERERVELTEMNGGSYRQAVPSLKEAEKKLGWPLEPTVLGGCPYL